MRNKPKSTPHQNLTTTAEEDFLILGENELRESEDFSRQKRNRLLERKWVARKTKLLGTEKNKISWEKVSRKIELKIYLQLNGGSGPESHSKKFNLWETEISRSSDKFKDRR